MPRPNRFTPAGEFFHITNRGNDKRVVFAKNADFQCFVDLLDYWRGRVPITIVAYCLMRTHFHLVLRPGSDTAISTYMHRVTGGYARYLRHTTGTRGYGHVFKDRFWDSAIRDHLHLLTVIAYVEGNPLEAGLVRRAEDWPWNSLVERGIMHPELIDRTAVNLPPYWTDWVNLSRDERFARLLRELV